MNPGNILCNSRNLGEPYQLPAAGTSLLGSLARPFALCGVTSVELIAGYGREVVSSLAVGDEFWPASAQAALRSGRCQRESVTRFVARDETWNSPPSFQSFGPETLRPRHVGERVDGSEKRFCCVELCC